MELKHNSVFEIGAGPLHGLYRVLFDEPAISKTIVMRIGDSPVSKENDTNNSPQTSPNKRTGKRKPQRNVGAALFLDRPTLELLQSNNELRAIELLLDGSYYLSESDPPEGFESPKASAIRQRKKKLIEKRRKAMTPFLSPQALRTALLETGSLSSLVAKVSNPRVSNKTRSDEVSKSVSTQIDSCEKMSRGLVYKCLTLLALHGFHESSLRLGFSRCGAKGVLRPCDPNGYQKAGRKSIAQVLATVNSDTVQPLIQPGMSTQWRNLILWADGKIPQPKPTWPTRCRLIVDKAFVQTFKMDEHGTIKRINPEPGKYPNNEQIKHVIETETPRLIMLRNRTTDRHFESAMRGFIGKNFEGVSGPGHTWAIDSTVSDLYLRSSLNPTWVIGRPIVYVVVDTWSTAVVGFYVCLTGPSWDQAKISLFSSAADPRLITDIWGLEFFPTLEPFPTLPFVLLCDRGEYLSKGASCTGIDLMFNLSYAPPFRGDLKGMVEVLHRIAKDEQFQFIPGAIDARRKEHDLRRFNPLSAVFTIRDFVAYLHMLFNRYNLTANRNHRLDAHMRASDVHPSPSGLWRWGHQVGLGFSRQTELSQLITSLLPVARMSSTRDGVMFAQRRYRPGDESAETWSANARHFGSQIMKGNYFPGSVSRVWTPNLTGKGLLSLKLDDHSTASPELTFEEVADAQAYSFVNKQRVDHDKKILELDHLAAVDKLKKEAAARLATALAAQTEAIPTLTEARQLEVAAAQSRLVTPSAPPAISETVGAGNQNHFELMDRILNTPAPHAMVSA